MAAPGQTQHDGEHGEPRPSGTGAGPSVVRSEERLRTRVVREEASLVRVRREVVTEEVMVPVTVRREVLRVETVDVAEGRPAGAAGGPREPLVVVLHEERPVVTLQTVPVEQVRVEVVEVAGAQRVRADLAVERVEVERLDGGAWSGGEGSGSADR